MFVRLLLVILSFGIVSIGSKASPVEVGPGSIGLQTVQQHRKGDSLLLSELPALVRGWTDKCLIEERTSSERALECWQHAAEALKPYIKDLRGPLIDQVEQLQSTWLKRVEDLQLYRRKPVAQSVAAIVRPVSTRFNQSDPNRLAETAMCSSRKLGDYRTCLASPVKIGDGRYKFKLKQECTQGSIAAISTTDEKGRCLRRVISLSAESRSVTVSSTEVPEILDAIPFGDGDIYECYERRHENVSCDGATDYSQSASLGENLPKEQAHAAAQQKIKARQQKAAVKKRLRQADQKSERRKKVVVSDGQNQKRLKKREATEKAALEVTAEKQARPKSKNLMCILFGRSCAPKT
jgi:hypothetical protein